MGRSAALVRTGSPTFAPAFAHGVPSFLSSYCPLPQVISFLFAVLIVQPLWSGGESVRELLFGVYDLDVPLPFCIFRAFFYSSCRFSFFYVFLFPNSPPFSVCPSKIYPLSVLLFFSGVHRARLRNTHPPKSLPIHFWGESTSFIRRRSPIMVSTYFSMYHLLCASWRSIRRK